MKRVFQLAALQMLFAFSVIGQPELHWRFANATSFTVGPDCIMQFDVELSCTYANTYHSSMMIYFDYNPAVFGSNIVANGKITYTAGTLMDLYVFGNPGYSWVNDADNTPQRYAITTEANFVVANPMFMEIVPTYPTFASFARFQIIVSAGGQAGIAFTPNAGPPTFVGLMDGNQYYVDATHPAETPYGIAPNYSGHYDNNLLLFDAVCCGPCHFTWTGSLSNNWFNPGNWDMNYVPGMSHNAWIPQNPPTLNDPLISAGEAYCHWIVIEPGATLHIDHNGSLSTGEVWNDGTIYIRGNPVSGEVGSFISNTMDGSGTFTMERPVKSWTYDENSPEGWHYIASPLTGTTWYTASMGDYWINAWNESTSEFYNFAPGSDPCIPAPETTWNSGVGYSVKYDPDYQCYTSNPGTYDVIEFTGPTTTVHHGDINVPIGASGAGLFSNWNLVGNPYPSVLNYELLYADGLPPGLDDAIYFWDDANLQYAAWISGGGVNGGSPYIEPGQGFFWHATAPTTLTFKNIYRDTQAGPFWKSSNNLVKLKVSGNGYKDETVIRFIDDATVAFDGDYDAYKMISVDFVPTLYTGGGDEKLSINSQPATEMVPMSFQTSTSGTYTIEVMETGDFENVVLEDLVTGVQTDLLTDSYTFAYNAGENAARFMVHFTPLGSPELEINSIRIYANQNNIVVNLPANVTGEVVVYNMIGTVIDKKPIIDGVNILTVSEVNTVYIVKVLADNSVVTKKVYIE